jgi:hypothetical protein
MRLLDTKTYTLSEFQGNPPPYAILSHVWGQEEVTFNDIATLEKAEQMKGFAKIVGACKTAFKNELQYIWIDTCCINKESSAELSEAINSMFIWYKNARVCYAYLSDVPSNEDHSALHSSFAMSQWFTRGWTLQELLAPSIVVFHSINWVDIGTKGTLRETISVVTGISVQHLMGFNKNGMNLTLEDVPVAVKMSWASHRLTTREEDAAYSLMGLFGVNMPLLYGEGEKAFIRLQHEIIKASDDHSIFAFTGEGMLARSASQFHQSGRVKLLGDIGEPQTPYSITNKGLHIQLPLCDVTHETSGEKGKVALLNCCLVDESERLVIILTASNGKGSYKRCKASELQFGIPLTSKWEPKQVPPAWQLHSIYILDHIVPQEFYGSREMDPGGINLLLTARVPTEYGRLLLFTKPGGKHSEGVKHIEVLWSAENEWGLPCPYSQSRELDLMFENHSRSDKFPMTFGLSKDAIMWCSIQTPEKTERKYFADRFSFLCDDKWAVTLTDRSGGTLSSGRGFAHHATIRIKRIPTPQSPVAMPERPIGVFPQRVAWLVTPATLHEYTSAKNSDARFWGHSQVNSIAHRGSLIVYVDSCRHWNFEPITVVPLKGSSSERPIYLRLGQILSSRSETHWSTEITQVESDAYLDLNNEDPMVGVSYSKVLEGGKSIYVSTWRCRDTTLADYVVKLSM